MKRLVCIVEGKGEVQAVPNLCFSVFRYLGVEGWLVDKEPIKQPRSQLVDARVPSPRRPCRKEGITRAVALARARSASAALLLCDADDDCPATWGPDACRAIPSFLQGAAVMASREYETWLLHSFSDEERRNAKVTVADLRRRDAKGLLTRLVPGYLPTTHQLDITRRIDVGRVRTHSDSFDKLVRDLARLCGVTAPPR
ncbi:hypothetical protein [Polyangium fumosum]|uniref:DUF4276 family protein n=1 Tax=Polyangium fumosum TaxID=889272 RepID=A0A4V5PKE9_9BACT|nr:hypothetical protein [Polyangium fumosum]TKC95288.1 hypothetical protein E8A74_47020 [Polyangium fumosum]